MENLMKTLRLLSERRVWIAILNAIVFILSFLRVEYQIDVPLLSELLTNAGIAFVNIVTTFLALWSFFRPKNNNQKEISN